MAGELAALRVPDLRVLVAELPLDALGTERWARVFAELAASYRRGTLKKSREAFSMIYDHHGIDPNPVRDKRVKLPHERKRDLIVQLAGHVETVAAVLPRQHLLPYLVIDWTGLRLGALEEAKVRDLDERRQAFLARASVTKNKKISERLGDTKVVTAEHYLYALGDYTEADYATALAR